jgi:hypothetical protein
MADHVSAEGKTMTSEVRTAIKVMLAQGTKPVDIANHLRVKLEDVLSVKRSTPVDAPQVERPALPPGKARSQASIDIAAAAAMQAEVTRRARRTRRSFL